MPKTDNNAYYIYNLCAITAIIILVFDLNIALGVAGGVPYILVVLISLWMPNKSFTVFIAVICSCLTIIGFYFSPEGGELWKILFNRGLALFAIWITAILTLQRKNIEIQYQTALDEKENALNELQVLQGIFPICTSCKKIRDDKSFCDNLEEYMKDNPVAKFTDGLCPDCANKHTPDYNLNPNQ